MRLLRARVLQKASGPPRYTGLGYADGRECKRLRQHDVDAGRKRIANERHHSRRIDHISDFVSRVNVIMGRVLNVDSKATGEKYIPPKRPVEEEKKEDDADDEVEEDDIDQFTRYTG